MGHVSQFRQSLVRAIMKTTNSKYSVVVGLVRAPGDLMVTGVTAIPLSR
jgi:hypothetical protein